MGHRLSTWVGASLLRLLHRLGAPLPPQTPGFHRWLPVATAYCYCLALSMLPPAAGAPWSMDTVFCCYCRPDCWQGGARKGCPSDRSLPIPAGSTSSRATCYSCCCPVGAADDNRPATSTADAAAATPTAAAAAAAAAT
jgi:hypothetical protein